MLKGHVFSKQLFSNNCFALFIDTFLGGHNGIVNGCTVTNTSETVTLNPGYFCIQGRFLQEIGGSTFNISSSEIPLFQQLICEIDLSKSNTTAQLNQAYYKILSSEEDYQELTQQDISVENQIYQFEFARWKVEASGITNFTDTREMLDFDSIYTEIRTTFNNLISDIEAEKTEFFENLGEQTEIDYAAFTAELERLQGTFETFLENLKDESEEELSDILEGFETEFTTWFDDIKDILDESTAGHLLNLINQLDTNKVDKEFKTGSSTVYKVLSDNNYSDTEKAKVAEVDSKAPLKKTWNITVNNEWDGTPVYELTSDTVIDSEKIYYTRSGEEGAYVYEEVGNPDVADIATYYEITSSVAPYTKQIITTGMLSTYKPQAKLVYSGSNVETSIAEDEAYSKISRIDSNNGSITLTCFEEVPDRALSLEIEVVF